MSLSRIRAEVPDRSGQELALDAEGDLKPFEVFIQLQRGRPPIYAGAVDARDAAMAMDFARQHYGRDQPCVAVWVAPRDAITRTNPDKDVVWRLSDQNYRLAKGYLGVRKKWLKFRSEDDLRRYQQEDLKEAF